MVIITDLEFADFLTKRPLYAKIKAVEFLQNAPNNYTNPLDFKDKPFKTFCPYEQQIQTFRTNIYGSTSMYHRSTDYNPDFLPDYFDPKTFMLDLSVYLIGKCQSCHKEIQYLVKATSDKPFAHRDDSDGITISLQKIGQWPSYQVEQDKSVLEYLTEEDKSNYKKALTCLSVNYGIGAYAYFRRIIENEIKRIVDDLSNLDFDGAPKIKEANQKYQRDHQMTSLIQSITPHLPKSLTELDDNPIKLLHDQLSGGIHSFAEEECLNRAQNINLILAFVVQKLGEKKFETKNIKQAMQSLRKNDG